MSKFFSAISGAAFTAALFHNPAWAALTVAAALAAWIHEVNFG